MNDEQTKFSIYKEYGHIKTIHPRHERRGCDTEEKLCLAESLDFPTYIKSMEVKKRSFSPPGFFYFFFLQCVPKLVKLGLFRTLGGVFYFFGWPSRGSLCQARSGSQIPEKNLGYPVPSGCPQPPPEGVWSRRLSLTDSDFYFHSLEG